MKMLNQRFIDYEVYVYIFSFKSLSSILFSLQLVFRSQTTNNLFS